MMMITGFGTSLQTRCLLQPDVLPKFQATHMLNGFLEVKGMAQTRGFSTLIYHNLWLFFLQTYSLLTLPRKWLRNQGIGALWLPLSMVTSVKSLVLLGLKNSSRGYPFSNLRRSSRLYVRIIRLFQSPVWVPCPSLRG